MKIAYYLIFSSLIAFSGLTASSEDLSREEEYELGIKQMAKLLTGGERTDGTQESIESCQQLVKAIFLLSSKVKATVEQYPELHDTRFHEQQKDSDFINKHLLKDPKVAVMIKELTTRLIALAAQEDREVNGELGRIFACRLEESYFQKLLDLRLAGGKDKYLEKMRRAVSENKFISPEYYLLREALNEGCVEIEVRECNSPLARLFHRLFGVINMRLLFIQESTSLACFSWGRTVLFCLMDLIAIECAERILAAEATE